MGSAIAYMVSQVYSRRVPEWSGGQQKWTGWQKGKCEEEFGDDCSSRGLDNLVWLQQT